MRISIFLCVLIFIIISSVHSRSWRHKESDENILERFRIESPSYSDLLALLTNTPRKMHKKSDYDDSIYQNFDNIMEDQPEQLTNRRILTVPTRPTSHRYRSPNAYGRKSHWDTFFGKK